jgi:hypothetical protein
MTAITDMAVAVMDLEMALMRAEVILVIEAEVTHVTESEIEFMVVAAAVTSHMWLKFPMFPRVKLHICCQTISGYRTLIFKDRHSFIVLNLEFSTPIKILDLKLFEASRAN